MGFFSNLKAKMDAAPKVDPMFQDTMILLYNLDKEKGIHFDVMCESLGIELVRVKEQDYLQPIGALAGISSVERVEEVYEGEESFTEIMAVMKNFTSIGMVTLKDKMKKTAGVANNFELETILTEKNMNLNSIELRDRLYEKKMEAIALRNAAKNNENE